MRKIEQLREGTPPELIVAGEDDIWVTRLLKGVSRGERNEACAQLAGYFIGKRFPRGVVVSILLCWNQRNDPPLPSEDVRRIVESMARAHARGSSGAEPNDDPLQFVLFEEYMARWGGEGVKWLIDDWLPERTVGFAIAPPGAYKTWLLLDLAVSVAGGVPFLGHFPVCRSGPVLILQQEDSHPQLAQRLAVIVHKRCGIEIPPHDPRHPDVFPFVMPPHLPIWLHPDARLRFDDDKAMRALARKVEDIRPILVLIDPLYTAADTTDYMAGTAREMLPLKSLRDAYGCSFMIAHHTRKGAAEGEVREQAWGSQFLNAFLETGWQIRPVSKAAITVQRHFKVRPPAASVRLTFDIRTKDSSRYEVQVEEVTTGAEKGASREAIKVGIRRYLAEHPGASQNAVVSGVVGANAAIRDALKEIVALGEVIMKKEASRHSYWLADDGP